MTIKTSTDLHNCLRKWLEIKESEGHRVDLDSVNLVDVAHSSLLNRIINEEIIFPEPPPRAYSYPWYDLIENKCAQLFKYEVFFDDHSEEPMVGICQSLWKIVENTSTNKYIVTYSAGHNDKERWSESRWLLEKTEQDESRPWLLSKIDEV